MKEPSERVGSDPLGLNRLGQVLAETIASAKLSLPSDWVENLSQIEQAYQGTLQAYSLLKDRYRLLKISSRQLAEELAWLRDQCDDFADERAELLDQIRAQKEKKG
jgi:hypothetical protein